MTSRVIFIPSLIGDERASFYQSVGKKLFDNGMEVIYLEVDKKNRDKSKTWLDPLEKLISDWHPNTWLVSHSSGTFATLRFLHDHKVLVAGWHIVASAFSYKDIFSESKDMMELVKTQAKNLLYPKIDYAKIREQVFQINLHYSRDDSVVNINQSVQFQKVFSEALVTFYSNYGHFLGSDFSELSDLILTQKKLLLNQIDGKIVRNQILHTNQLPLILPKLEDYLPSKDGKAPLSKTDWSKIKDKNEKIVGQRETDVMPNWAGSSWYFLRFLDPKNQEKLADPKKLKYWLPVDHYFGGGEHTTLHLLYSRFWHRFLYDVGQVPTPEPYQKRTNGGILLGPDGQKMSKSKGNFIKVLDKIDEYGADAVRLYIAFIGPVDATVIWNDGGMKACAKLVETIYNLSEKVVNYGTKANLDVKTLPIILDFDGVLGDTLEAWIQVEMEQGNLPYQKARENIINKHLKAVMPEVDLSNQTSKVYETTYQRRQRVAEIGFSLFGDFVEVLKSLQNKYNLNLAVVSNNSRKMVLEPYLKNSGLKFSHILGIEDGNSKEKRVQTIIDDWQVNSKEVFFVADTLSDIFELEKFLDKNKILGASWGWHGSQILNQKLPWSQILHTWQDLDKFVEWSLIPDNLDPSFLTSYHKFIYNITETMTQMRNNVSVAEIMTFTNHLKKQTEIPMFIWLGFLKAIAPFVPFISEEIWFKATSLDDKEHKNSIHLTFYPEFTPTRIVDETVTIAVQVNGKLRGTILVSKDALDEEVLEKAGLEVKKWLEGKKIRFSKVIPNKIVTFAI